MNISSDVAEQIIRMSLEGLEMTVKVTGKLAKEIAALLMAVMKNKQPIVGKTTLTKMLKSGKELKVFSVKQNEFKKFTQKAKQYGVLYTVLKEKKEKDGIIDILVKIEDAPKINRIIDRFHLSNYKSENIEEERKSSNPNLASIEKGPRSKHSLTTQKTSDRGTKNYNNHSIKEKLQFAKKESERTNRSKVKSEIFHKAKKIISKDNR